MEDPKYKELNGILKGGLGSGKVGHTTVKQILSTSKKSKEPVSKREVSPNEVNLPSSEHKKLMNDAYDNKAQHIKNIELLHNALRQQMNSNKEFRPSKEFAAKLKHEEDSLVIETERLRHHTAQAKQNWKLPVKEDTPNKPKSGGLMTGTKRSKAANEKIRDRKFKKSSYYDLIETLNKSVIAVDEQGSAIETANYAIDLDLADQTWLDKFTEVMTHFNYGDAPRTIELNDSYQIILVKVDDGLYSGIVKQKIDWDGSSALMENVAKVEKQTIPTIIQFLKAKEYLKPIPKEIQQVMAKPEITTDVVNELPVTTTAVENRSLMHKLLDLLDKLI